MLGFDKRIENIEALTSILANKCSTELITTTELKAVVTDIWSRIEVIKTRTSAIENTIAIIKEILTTNR
jgi:hypothetical protein